DVRQIAVANEHRYQAGCCNDEKRCELAHQDAFPNRPLGQTSTTRTTRVNDAIRAAVELSAEAKADSTSPMIRPPATAPGMLPSPPSTTTTKAFSIGSSPI